MKAQLTRIVESVYDLIVSLWNLLAAIWNACRWRKLSVPGKILYVLFFTAVTLAVISACLNYYNDNYGREEEYRRYNEEDLSQHIVTHDFKDNKVRVYNTETGKYTTPKLDWVYIQKRDTLAVFSRKGKLGFLNINNGRIVIKNQYDEAWEFSEGLAAVVKNGKIGFINAGNEVVIPFQYHYPNEGALADYGFSDGHCIMTDGHGSCGIIDRSGKWIIEPIYDSIEANAGYRILKDGDKYGLLNPQLKFVYPTEYDSIEFSNVAGNIILSKDGRKWRVDSAGNVTHPFMVDYTYLMHEPSDSYNMSSLSDYLKFEINGRFGVMRRDNCHVIIPAIYNYIELISTSMFEARIDDFAYLFIDTDGNIVEDPACARQ